MRSELVYYLKELADPELRKREWLPNHGGFDYVVHFFFDDTSPETAVGVFLENAEERTAVLEVVEALDEVLTRHGNGLSDPEYIATPEWPSVVAAAAAALHTLLATAEAQ